MQKSGGRFLVTDENCPAIYGHSAFCHTNRMGPGFFAIATGTEESQLCVADGSRKCVHYDEATKPVLACLLEMNFISIPAHSLFVVRGCLKHTGAAWSGAASLCYHVYLITENHELLDLVALAYVWNFRKQGDPNLTIYSVFKIPGLSGKATTNGTVGYKTGQFGEYHEDDGMVSKTLYPDS